MDFLPKGTSRILAEGLNIGVGLKGTEYLVKVINDKGEFLDKYLTSVPRALKGITLGSVGLVAVVPRLFKKTKVNGKSLKLGPFSANRIIRIMTATTVGLTFLGWLNVLAGKVGAGEPVQQATDFISSGIPI